MDDKAKCVICWQVLGSKKLLLHGMKCQRFHIYDKLRLILCPLDLKTLYDTQVFPEPRICNLCFVTIKQIPQGIQQLQDLLGVSINLKLSDGQREDWEANTDVNEVANTSHASLSTSSVQSPFLHATIAKSNKQLQDFLGVSINLKLSGRQGEDWQADVNEVVNSTHASLSTSSFQSPFLHATITKSNKLAYMQAEKGPKPLKLSKRAHKLSAFTNKNSTHIRCKSTKQHKTKEQGRSLPSHTMQIKLEESEKSQSRSQHVDNKVRDSSDSVLVKDNQHMKSNNIQECTPLRLAFGETANSSTAVHPLVTAPTVVSPRQESTCASPSLLGDEVFTEKNTNLKCNTASTTKHRDEKQNDIQRALVNSSPVITNNSLTKLRSMHRQNWDCRTTCDMSLSNHRCLKFKVSGKNGKRRISKVSNIHDVNSVSSMKQNHETRPKEAPVSIVKHNKCSGLTINLAKSKKANIKTNNTMQICQRVTRKSKHEQMRDITNDIDREENAVPDTEIISQICNHSHKKLQQLEEKVKLYISSKNVSPSRIPMMKCPEKGCDYLYPLWRHLVVHIRYYHHSEKTHTYEREGCRKTVTTSTDLNVHRNTHKKKATFCCEICGKQFLTKSGLNSHQRKIHATGRPGRYKCTFEGCNCTFVRKEKLELHLCTHSPECILFCEKCGKQFGCQRYLDVHYKVHEKNMKNSLHPPERTVTCEVSGCMKTFTSRVYMKRHIISYHMGRRPRPQPGVLFACTIEGCGKKFSLKSTLSRHNLLVHKGGDYKLNRAVVKYPCTYNGCDKVLNRKNLLEDHMVTEHAKVPRKLLNQQMRELNCREKICTKCGMVLAFSQMAHHEDVQHSTESHLDMEEISPYTCQLEGCGAECRTQADRLAHVQKHIENPPFKCEVVECKETFYLLKNLDNHLWDHSKKPSVCDADGCSQTFDDQLQLAKHSRLHYDGRMKCPWKKCGSWFTALGTLKQHFLTHSRSLMANFGWDFICDQCERVFSSKYGLRNHKKTHEDSVSENLSSVKTAKFVCEEPGCKTEFSQHKEFFDHFLHHYTNTPAACGFEGCSETLPTMLLKSKHGKSHYGGRYMCPWQNCDKMFASSFFQVKKHLYRHLLSSPSIAADRSHSCPQCDMVFRFENNLKSHTSQHSEKTDYVCTVCGKKFHYNHLKRHMLTHRQEKPHVCSHCGVRYGTVNGLKFHILQKHNIGKWPFKCSYCDKGFISSTELRRHLPSHTKEKPFSCDLCGDTFATHTGYKGHMRKHAGQKFACDVEGCRKVYTTSLSLRGHKAEHAGFSQACSYCGKMYKNPYGHKCKASREAKQKRLDEAPIKPNSIVIPSASAVSVPASVSASHEQRALIITPSVATLGAEMQLADRNTVVPNCIQPTYLSVPSVTQSLTLRLAPDMPEDFIHALPSHGMVQDRSLPLALDITRGTHINISGDYTFNNYVVLWDSQNVL